jgi:hypothetical protein
MSISRRRLFQLVPGAAFERALFGSQAGGGGVPWHQRIRRCGQLNLNERDPETLNIREWVDYWASLKLDALVLNAGGIVCFYPTRVPFQNRSRFLGDRDLFGDFSKALKASGIRVIARLDPNAAGEDAWKAHPEWFERDKNGERVWHRELPGLYKTCMFSTYFSEQITAIIREINSLYEVDGFFTNTWPKTNGPHVCHCRACGGRGERGNPVDHERHIARVAQVWHIWDGAAKEKKLDSLYIGNLGGGIRALHDVKKIGELASWFNADHQGRSGATPVWNCAQQGRVARSVMGGRTVTNVIGAYATGRPAWRHTSKAPAEATMWMAQTCASGMVPWYHWLGGTVEDQRWRETGRRFYQWHAKHEAHFVNRRSVANIGVVLSEKTASFYKPPDGGSPAEFLEGLYYALLEGRFLFDFVHEQNLDAATLKKYSLLILPNTAILTGEQCNQIRNYARNGGSVLATFETSRYAAPGKLRDNFGLGDLLGIQTAGELQGPTLSPFYARIETPHPILDSFEDTQLLPGAEYRVPVKTDGKLVMSVVPPYTASLPEKVFPEVSRSTDAAVSVVEGLRNRAVYFAGDIERSFWRSGNPDIGVLLQNSIRWLLRDSMPVSAVGDGLFELFAWETAPGFALHVLNYTNPNMHRGWIRRSYPVGPLQVRFEIPSYSRITRVQLLRAEANISYKQDGRGIQFEIPRIYDYEIAALYAA